VLTEGKDELNQSKNVFNQIYNFNNGRLKCLRLEFKCKHFKTVLETNKMLFIFWNKENKSYDYNIF